MARQKRKPYSRKARVEQKRSVRTIVKYVVLSITFIVAMWFLGIPIIARFTTLISDQKADELTFSEDTTPPPPPLLEDIPEYTNKSVVTVRGTTEAGATAKIFVNNLAKEVLSGADGGFSTNVDIASGENTIYATAIDDSGNEGGRSDEYKVVKDTESPELTVAEPSEGQTFRGEENNTITVKGIVDSDSSVKVNDRIATVMPNGEYRLRYTLNEGDNELKVVAEDRAGNKTEQTVNVHYEK